MEDTDNAIDITGLTTVANLPATTNADVPTQPHEVMTTYIPISLRAKMPLRPSKMIVNDSRVSNEYARVTTTLEAADRLHQSYLTQMSGFAREIAETELAARLTLLDATYCEALETISQGLVYVQIHLSGDTPENFNEIDIAAVAAAFVHAEFPANHWGSLPFIDSTTDRDAYILRQRQKLTDGQKIIATTIHADNARGASVLCKRVVDELTKIIPALTTDLWNYDVKLDQTKALDAKLRTVTSKKAVDKANTRLNDALDNDAGELVRPLVNQEVRHELNKALSRKKKSTRKNSSAEDRTPSLQAVSGQRNSKNSGERRKKRHERDTSTDSSSRSGRRRGRSRPRKSTDKTTQDKPDGILRYKTDKFRPRRGQSSDESSDNLTVYADHHPAKHRVRGGRNGGNNRDNQGGAKSGDRARNSSRN